MAWSAPTHFGVDAEAARQLAHTLGSPVPAFADDVRRAELLRQCNPLGISAEDDDLLGAEPSGSDDPAQAHGAVADHGRPLAGADLRRHGRMVARSHDIRQRQERRHQGVVGADRQDKERSVADRPRWVVRGQC
jgi:hypothetical protein